MKERKAQQAQGRRLDADAALRVILEGTATETGAAFFSALVRVLAHALGTHGAWVTEYLPEERKLRALAFWLGGDFLQEYETVIDGTPCEAVIERSDLVHYPDKVFDVYPMDEELRSVDAVSYMGGATEG